MPLKMMKFYSDLVDEQVERNADNSVSAAEYERLVTAVKLYRSTITNAVEGIIQTTTDGKFLNVNPAFAKMLGYQSPQELIDDIESIDAQVYVSAEVRREFLENIDRDGKAKCEYQAWKKNGSTTWLLASSRVVKDATGKFLYYESIVEDISDRKEKQAQLEKLAASLSRSNAELKRFASTVAHDISSPINTVQSFCELLQLTCSDKLDAKEKEYFEMIIGGTKRIRAIISDILEFSMIESSGLKEEDIDLNLLINEVLHDLSTAIARERAQVVCSHLPTVKGDRPKMLRLFQNLIGNKQNRLHR